VRPEDRVERRLIADLEASQEVTFFHRETKARRRGKERNDSGYCPYVWRSRILHDTFDDPIRVRKSPRVDRA
jgi:hypothetical protein